MWRFLHNCVAHPMLFFTNDHQVAVEFHDYTAMKMPVKYIKVKNV